MSKRQRRVFRVLRVYRFNRVTESSRLRVVAPLPYLVLTPYSLLDNVQDIVHKKNGHEIVHLNSGTAWWCDRDLYHRYRI